MYACMYVYCFCVWLYGQNVTDIVYVRSIKVMKIQLAESVYILWKYNIIETLVMKLRSIGWLTGDAGIDWQYKW